MNGQLALALLALGPIKTSLGQPPAPAAQPAVERATPLPSSVPKNARDPIAFLAREWLEKR